MTHQFSLSVNNQRCELASIETDTLVSIFFYDGRLKNYAHWDQGKAELIVQKLWSRVCNVEDNFPELKNEYLFQSGAIRRLEAVCSDVYEYSEVVRDSMQRWERQREVMQFYRCHPYKAAFYYAMVNWLKIPIIR